MKRLFALLVTICSLGFAQTNTGGGGGSGGGGGGGVSNFSSGNLSPLFTTSVTYPTTTPILNFTLDTPAANTVFGNFTGGPAAPTFTAAPTFSGANLTNLPFMSLTTTGSSGPASLSAGVLNIPQYSGGGGGTTGATVFSPIVIQSGKTILLVSNSPIVTE